MTISVNGITMVLIEIKNRKKGDAYMQASRGYEVITEALTENKPNFVARGAPTFISCLNGQSRFSLNRKCIADIIHADEELRIAGAFKDGSRSL
jgi:diphthamide biosynthesis methyltransferase